MNTPDNVCWRGMTVCCRKILTAHADANDQMLQLNRSQQKAHFARSLHGCHRATCVRQGASSRAISSASVCGRCATACSSLVSKRTVAVLQGVFWCISVSRHTIQVLLITSSLSIQTSSDRGYTSAPDEDLTLFAT